MLSRVYLLVLAVFAAANCAIQFYAGSWLGSIGDPRIASDAFQALTSKGWTFLWISFVILTVFSLVLTWKSASKWAICFAMGYFVAFMSFTLYNDRAYERFLAENSIASSEPLLNPFYVAVIFLVVALALISAYFVTSNLRVRVKVQETEKVAEENSGE